jgi:hypothetical protein
MMLRAGAPVFTPKESPAEYAEKAVKENSEFVEESCSTVAPSPALTHECNDPQFSPCWGFSPFVGYMTDEYGNFMPEFTLPEVLTDENGYPVFEIPEFTLDGAEELESSLVGVLKQRTHSEDSQESTTTGDSSPPQSPIRGIAAPPGLEHEISGMPPGLEAITTVAELHAHMKKGLQPLAPTPWARPRAETWPAQNQKVSSPLPHGTTTAMWRNIPNKYTQAALIGCLNDAGYRGELDFIYLPIDFKNKCNVGYAFVNFRTAEACTRFASEYHHCNSRDKLPGYNSRKVCEVSAARFQGCEENVRRLQASKVMSELLANPEWLPKLFDEEGKEMDFPIPGAWEASMAKEVSQKSHTTYTGRQNSRQSSAQMHPTRQRK